MINTLKKIIDLSKGISDTNEMIFSGGQVFNYGTEDQYIKAIVDIKDNKNVKKLGLDEMTFKIDYLAFLAVEKDYKKEYTEMIESEDCYILKTKIPNVEFKLFKLKEDEIPEELFDLDSLEFYGTFEFDEENKKHWIDNTVQKIYFNFDENSVEFNSTKAESFLYCTVLSNKFVKINNADTKKIEVDIYDYRENEFLLHWKIYNKDFITNVFFISIDSPEIEEE